MMSMDSEVTLIEIIVTCTNEACENVGIPLALLVPDAGQGQAVCGPCGTVLWTRP